MLLQSLTKCSFVRRSFYRLLIILLAGVVVPILLTVVLWPAQAAAGISDRVGGAPTINLVDAFPNLTFSSPVDIANAGDNRLFIVEQAGFVRVTPLDPASASASTFLDIHTRVNSGGERGLLGLAFHPDYARNGFFYVNYTHDNDGQLVTRISRFTVTADPNMADPDSELILLQVDQPFSNHNAGDLNFGPDGYLYVGLGDGGSGGDPGNRAQNLGMLLGKMLRLDVDGGGLPPDCGLPGHYTIPADNPFVGMPGNVCDEIWAYGLRNPWRFSFDRQTGDMFIGDVGQGTWEEVDFQPAGSLGGENYGWRCYEGNQAYNTSDCSTEPADYVFPIHQYNHDSSRCSITGGFMYRGAQYPALQGHYLYGDFCSRDIWALTFTGGAWVNHFLLKAGNTLVTFGEDACGELYVNQGGRIYRVQEASSADAPSLCLSKSGPATAVAGDLITYTLHLNNTGNAAATGLIITDTMPVGASYVSGGTLVGNTVTWALPSLAAKATATLQFAVTATQTVTNADYIANADGGYQVSGGSIVVTHIEPPVSLLTIGKEGPAVAEPFMPITYQLTIRNTSTLIATGLVITDTLPSGAVYVSGGTLAGDTVSWNLDSLPAQAAATMQFTVVATRTIVNDDYGVTADGGYSASGSHAVITVIVPPEPALTISKSGPTEVEAGEPIPYVLTIRNDGHVPATNLVITDTVPTGTSYVGSSDGGTLADEIVTWYVAMLPAHSTITRTFTVTTAATAVVNDDYGVTAEGGYHAVGTVAVVTLVNPYHFYLPVLYKP